MNIVNFWEQYLMPLEPWCYTTFQFIETRTWFTLTAQSEQKSPNSLKKEGVITLILASDSAWNVLNPGNLYWQSTLPMYLRHTPQQHQQLAQLCCYNCNHSRRKSHALFPHSLGFRQYQLWIDLPSFKHSTLWLSLRKNSRH